MKIILENRHGKIVMGGERYGFNIISAEGLGLITKSYTTVESVGRSGQETINVHENSRVITIGGDIFASSSKKLNEALKILSEDVWLTVLKGEKRRKIYTKIKNFEIYNKNAGYLGFVLQLEADNPYFSDEEPNREYLFKRKNLVCGELTLPCVFTQRIVGASITNKGNAKSYPVIYIYDTGDGDTDAETKSIVLINETTGASVEFEYKTQSGETLTIDFSKRLAQSNLNGDITPYLALENYLSEFYIDEGENLLGITNSTSREISAECVFDNNYNECI